MATGLSVPPQTHPANEWSEFTKSTHSSTDLDQSKQTMMWKYRESCPDLPATTDILSNDTKHSKNTKYYMNPSEESCLLFFFLAQSLKVSKSPH